MKLRTMATDFRKNIHMIYIDSYGLCIEYHCGESIDITLKDYSVLKQVLLGAMENPVETRMGAGEDAYQDTEVELPDNGYTLISRSRFNDRISIDMDWQNDSFTRAELKEILEACDALLEEEGK